MKKTKTKDLNYYKNNCEEDYIKTPISVLRYISELEQAINYTRCSIELPNEQELEKLTDKYVRKLDEGKSYYIDRGFDSWHFRNGCYWIIEERNKAII